jgi:rhodanese-related sulfurtransferase
MPEELPPDDALDRILANEPTRITGTPLRYGGQVTPVEAYALWVAGRAKIVDVRHRFEYEYVGRIANTPNIPWKNWPDGSVNAGFLDALAEQYQRDDVILFLCRSGVRSHAAAEAATAVGFTQCYNIVEGFEGDRDEFGHRGQLGGWRKHGLPWTQD